MRGRRSRTVKGAGETRASPRARRGHSRKRERTQGQRGRVFDRRLAAIAVALTVAALALARHFANPTGPTGWSWPVLMLCVLVAAAAGRGLVGFRSVGEEEEQPSRRFRAAIWLVLLGAAILPNLPALRLGLLSDDFGLLRAARLASGPLDVARLLPLRIFYRPVSLLLWWVGLHIWNGSALGYHLLSLALHAGTTALLYLLARRYMGSVYGGAMAGLLFAVHPFHVETTVWPSAQPDLLCAAFSLASMWCVEEYLSLPHGRRQHLALAGMFLTFLLAVWSKETAVALPGVVFVRLALVPGGRRWARAVGVSAAYAFLLGVYMSVRFLMLGTQWMGGLGTQVSFLNAVFPAIPFMLTGQFFFPVHMDLFGSLPSPYLGLVVIAVMAVALVWWIRSLEFVSWQRLVLYTSYLLVPTIPVSTAGLTLATDMSNSRYGYLPSVGLALLFGEICARRPGRWRQTGLIGVATVLFAAVLSGWYIAPWREAARLRDEALAGAIEVVARLPDSPPVSALFFEGVPGWHRGAQVFGKGCFRQALPPLLDREVSVEEVADSPGTLDDMSVSDLLPGEYLLSWDAESRAMVLKRAGGHPLPEPVPEAVP